MIEQSIGNILWIDETTMADRGFTFLEETPGRKYNNMEKKKVIRKSKAQPKLSKTPPAPPIMADAIPLDLLEAPEESAGKFFPIVGIGASAGGLAAFEAFFSGMPKDIDPGMAFVVVQHLDPNHKSILTDLIRRYTRMQVVEVEDGMVVQPNTAYIIPPARDMAFLNGALNLLEPSAPRGQRLPIDFFFRSLAQDQHERAIGIILSGTGSDGTLGVRAIKGEGGMVMVQTPETAEYDGMPTNAIATGMVDYELPPAEMAAQLISYWAKSSDSASTVPGTSLTKAEGALRKIFILLRSQTGHDFSMYKINTIQRRIKRRMVVHQIDTMEAYVRYLQREPDEAAALFADLLIGVTNFFRDPEAFKVLEEEVIPKLFAGRGADSVVRIWSSGCSTGEEAYSLAILLAERQEIMKRSFKVQIFATDIDSQAIGVARAGKYPSSITADVSPERLARYFSADSDGGSYRVHKAIRDMLVFSEQNVVKDPPFSKLDLLCCRNVMIYMGGELQKKLIPLFHYALNPGGYLFLGTSETVGEFSDLFSVVERKSKIYRRKEMLGLTHIMGMNRFVNPVTAIDAALPRKVDFSNKTDLRQLTEQSLLREGTLSAALVNGQGDILYLHGRTGMYLEPAPGEAGTANILKMAREGLRPDLTTALHKAVVSKEAVVVPGLRVKTNGDFSTVNLSVRPVAAGTVAAPDTTMYLVVLEAAPVSAAEKEHAEVPYKAVKGSEPKADSATKRIEALQLELRTKEEYLKTANEELETSNEELKSSNEEMQSVNEELQSTNEELETSKEELQSVNEELATVNAELQTKVNDLSRVNDDMNNLLSGTGIATVFVDHHLRILRFTPGAARIINFISSDVGRPVSHIVSNLSGYDTLTRDVQGVLDTLIPKDVEVQTTGGEYFAMHIVPYRTTSNVIEGVVITFTDITGMKLAQEALRKANNELRLAVVVRDAHDAITVQDLEGRTIAWNPGAVRMYGWTEAEALSMNVRDRIPQKDRGSALDKLHALSQSSILEPYNTSRLTKAGKAIEVSIISTALMDKSGKMYAIATTEREVAQATS